MNRRTILLLAILIAAALFQNLKAAVGDIVHVKSHERTFVVTDPTKGTNSYPRWANFPGKETSYRRIVLWITYRCPDGLRCGEWDYIDAIYLRRLGNSKQKPRNIELARMISPYGSRFDSTWSFTWHTDITDFGLLLHDSVEVDFVHTGYESNTDRGWLIDLDFEIMEGTPAMECVGMDTLWCGTFAYGDSTKPIEKSIRPIKFKNRTDSDIARLRVVQTGHGMDDAENCAEFCSKYRRVVLDDSVVNERQIWRKCGDNPLYPQAGTWIFDRANWCPGGVVYPDVYDSPIAPKSAHSIDLELEPYINRSKPTANYHIYSYLFYCKAPTAENDVSLEEIIMPSREDEYSRLNPICSEARIRVKNSGKAVLTSMAIDYGAENRLVIPWTGRIESQQTSEIVLPGPFDFGAGRQTFSVELNSPNGSFDAFPADNNGNSQVTLPPVYDSRFVLVVRSNHDSLQTSYQITDNVGNVVRSREFGTLAANTTYYDTLSLNPGCYQLVVSDSAGDGLDFWFNAEGGYGFVRLLDMKGRLMKSFLSDFGSEIRHSFSVAYGAAETIAFDELPIVNPFPPRNQGSFDVDVFLNEPADLRLFVVDEKDTKLILDQLHTQFKEGMIPVNITGEPDGIYYVKVTVAGKTVARRIRIKHDS